MNNRILKSSLIAASLVVPQMGAAKMDLAGAAKEGGHKQVIAVFACIAATMPDGTKLAYGEQDAATTREKVFFVRRGKVSLGIDNYIDGMQYVTFEDKNGVTSIEADGEHHGNSEAKGLYDKMKQQFLDVCELSNKAGGSDAGHIADLDKITRSYFALVGKQVIGDKVLPLPAPKTPAPKKHTPVSAPFTPDMT